MVRYKLMFKDNGRRYYNFGPTIRTGQRHPLRSITQARRFLQEVKKVREWKGRVWKIKRR
jgi:hypothetical protein